MRYAFLIALVALAACSERHEPAVADAGTTPAAAAPAASATLTPEQLGELGAQIKKEPARADELLSRHGLTTESFEAAIRRVTEDPQASKRYADAFRKASA